jgi:hypothetical protein
MLMDCTLQALLRGNARMGVDGDCGVMEAVIPQTKQTGLSEADYRRMFPGAVLVHDRVLMPAKPLRGNLKRIADRVIELRAAGHAEIPNPLLYDSLGVAGLGCLSGFQPTAARRRRHGPQAGGMTK